MKRCLIVLPEARGRRYARKQAQGPAHEDSLWHLLSTSNGAWQDAMHRNDCCTPSAAACTGCKQMTSDDSQISKQWQGLNAMAVQWLLV